jgi:hypothetical protein
MVENGSHRGAPALPPEQTHSEFLELCARATSGLLSADQEQRLQAHLEQCASCRKALAQYQVLADRVIPALASEHVEKFSENFPDPEGEWSLEEAEAALFRRLEDKEQAERSSAIPFPAPPRANDGDRLWKYMWWQYAAALLLLVALGVAVYRLEIRRGSESARPIVPIAATTPAPIAPEPQNQPSGPGLKEKDAQIASLRAQLAQQANQISQLKSHELQVEGDLQAKSADADRLARERADLAQQLTIARTSLEEAQAKLNTSDNENTADAVQIAALEAKVTELNTALHQRDQEVARERELLDHDRDIRDLMTARDLHIADVYDIAEDGKTEKAFGRVFYARGKSLTFYAYDLDQHPGLKRTSTFQVWGRRGPDEEKAVNLGILYQDDAAKKRWVLKSHDAKTLEEIDAVFVTVEPIGGSQHPSTKPLLFGYLRNEPNHP